MPGRFPYHWGDEVGGCLCLSDCVQRLFDCCT